MDEITLDDQTYVSSKRAAQITGYAKDYVGQLCREGRVAARLVGRNWYVLEDSIREHRFGVPAKAAGSVNSEENTTNTVNTSPIEVSIPNSTDLSDEWKSSNYTSELSPELPTFNTQEERPGVRVFEPLPTENETVQDSELPANSSVVKEMQSAWHDWFSRGDDSTGSEDILSESSEEIEPTESPKAFEEGEDDTEDVQVPISRVREPVEPQEVSEDDDGDAEGEIEEEEVVPIRRSYKIQPPQRSSEEYVPEGRIIREKMVTRKVVKTKTTVIRHSKQSSLILKTIFISVTCLVVLLTAIATGKLDTFFSREKVNYAPINYLQGEHTIENAK